VQEHPDIVCVQNAVSGYPNPPKQQRALFEPVADAADGRLQFLDTDAT
jgi:hypothetical protein